MEGEQEREEKRSLKGIGGIRKAKSLRFSRKMFTRQFRLEKDGKGRENRRDRVKE